ncbi:aromatic prenyltransferase [Colletotrichum cuscutae]|uniref:Aromatic prenyltransferase n=1 Tax=Colletotrichum cuscutae TaxID=1209917 RepID=A0AAI9U9H7_9PEZI|nr:aromatic prenyltransferase [Colletotrichum cuscutae]
MPGLTTQTLVQSEKPEKPLVVWQSLKKCLPPAENKDVEFWWNLTGYHLAVMIDAAGYSTQLQYETLLFHYHWIVPRLGPAPHPDGTAVFKSLVAYDGSPFEYSWKWNTTSGEPDIRYSWEAINNSSGTAADPLNHDPTLDYMEKVPSALSGVDFSWYRHFLAELYNPDRSVYAKELENGDPPATTLMHAVEYNKKASFGLKSYFLPRKLFQGGDPATLGEWDAAIKKLNPDGKHPGRDALMHFLANSPEGRLMKPNVMGMDNVTPSKSRLKMYFTSRHTCFNSVREVITMGGLRDVSEASLQDLRSLILAILGLPEDYPEDAEFAPTSASGDNKWDDFDALCEGFTYFFDIAPSSGTPDVKFYLPTRKYGPDDLTIARNLVAWLRERGRGAYCNEYLAMLEKLAVHRGLENGKGMHAYISYQCTDKGEPDIKSYISPELYHKARYLSA